MNKKLLKLNLKCELSYNSTMMAYHSLLNVLLFKSYEDITNKPFSDRDYDKAWTKFIDHLNIFLSTHIRFFEEFGLSIVYKWGEINQSSESIKLINRQFKNGTLTLQDIPITSDNQDPYDLFVYVLKPQYFESLEVFNKSQRSLKEDYHTQYSLRCQNTIEQEIFNIDKLTLIVEELRTNFVYFNKLCTSLKDKVKDVHNNINEKNHQSIKDDIDIIKDSRSFAIFSMNETIRYINKLEMYAKGIEKTAIKNKNK